MFTMINLEPYEDHKPWIPNTWMCHSPDRVAVAILRLAKNIFELQIYIMKLNFVVSNSWKFLF